MCDLSREERRCVILLRMKEDVLSYNGGQEYVCNLTMEDKNMCVILLGRTRRCVCDLTREDKMCDLKMKGKTMCDLTMEDKKMGVILQWRTQRCVILQWMTK